MKFCKLEIFIPKTYFTQLLLTLQKVGAGHIGNYDSCLSYSEVIGMWRPLSNANPFLGEQGKTSQETELKVEVRILHEKLNETLEAIKKIHPYEMPVINIIPILNEE